MIRIPINQPLRGSLWLLPQVKKQGLWVDIHHLLALPLVFFLLLQICACFHENLLKYTPGSSNIAGKWRPRIESMYFPLEMVIFHCYVSFPNCIRLISVRCRSSGCVFYPPARLCPLPSAILCHASVFDTF